MEKSGKESVSLSLHLEEPDLEALIEILSIYRIIRDMLNDQLIKDLSNIVSSLLKLVNAVSSTDLIEILERSLQDPELDKALLNPPRIGLMGLYSALRDEDVQKGIGIVITLLKAIGKASTNQ
ncbi:MAG TPA: DUF1641 domain-containing protein [Candidatus Korarchaeota archaeon]|nr:DUF1641 domain-containing protein [Candidatus Korarchaeota archaeon]